MGNPINISKPFNLNENKNLNLNTYEIINNTSFNGEPSKNPLYVQNCFDLDSTVDKLCSDFFNSYKISCLQKQCAFFWENISSSLVLPSEQNS